MMKKRTIFRQRGQAWTVKMSLLIRMEMKIWNTEYCLSRTIPPLTRKSNAQIRNNQLHSSQMILSRIIVITTPTGKMLLSRCCIHTNTSIQCSKKSKATAQKALQVRLPVPNKYKVQDGIYVPQYFGQKTECSGCTCDYTTSSDFYDPDHSSTADMPDTPTCQSKDRTSKILSFPALRKHRFGSTYTRKHNLRPLIYRASYAP